MFTDKFDATTLPLGVILCNPYDVIESASFSTDSLGLLRRVRLERSEVVDLMATNACAVFGVLVAARAAFVQHRSVLHQAAVSDVLLQPTVFAQVEGVMVCPVAISEDDLLSAKLWETCASAAPQGHLRPPRRMAVHRRWRWACIIRSANSNLRICSLGRWRGGTFTIGKVRIVRSKILWSNAIRQDPRSLLRMMSWDGIHASVHTGPCDNVRSHRGQVSRNMGVAEEFWEVRHGAVMHRVHCVDPFANPATQSLLEGFHVLHELVDVVAKVLAHGPGLDVGVQGPSATGLHFPTYGKERSIGAEDEDGGGDAVGAPLVWNLESFGASGLGDTVWTHTEHKEVEKADEELEHDRLSHRVVNEAQPHFHVRRNITAFIFQIYVLALDKKQSDVSRVSQIRRREDDGRAP